MNDNIIPFEGNLYEAVVKGALVVTPERIPNYPHIWGWMAGPNDVNEQGNRRTIVSDADILPWCLNHPPIPFVYSKRIGLGNYLNNTVEAEGLVETEAVFSLKDPKSLHIFQTEYTSLNSVVYVAEGLDKVNNILFQYENKIVAIAVQLEGGEKVLISSRDIFSSSGSIKVLEPLVERIFGEISDGDLPQGSTRIVIPAKNSDTVNGRLTELTYVLHDKKHALSREWENIAKLGQEVQETEDEMAALRARADGVSPTLEVGSITTKKGSVFTVYDDYTWAIRIPELTIKVRGKEVKAPEVVVHIHNSTKTYSTSLRLERVAPLSSMYISNRGNDVKIHIHPCTMVSPLFEDPYKYSTTLPTRSTEDSNSEFLKEILSKVYVGVDSISNIIIVDSPPPSMLYGQLYQAFIAGDVKKMAQILEREFTNLYGMSNEAIACWQRGSDLLPSAGSESARAVSEDEEARNA